MRVFLSYASERRELADRLHLTLRAEGHKVFFDKSSLPAGHSFDDRIRKALRESDLLLFLVSPESVEPGNYALSELALARERWPSPDGFVLPVLVEPVPHEQISAYLQSVTILIPQGNLIAETVGAVDQLARLRRRKLTLQLAGLALLMSMLVAFGFLVAKWQVKGRIEIQTTPPERLTRGFFSSGDVYHLQGQIRNRTISEIEIEDLQLETGQQQLEVEIISRNPVEFPVRLRSGDSLGWELSLSLLKHGENPDHLREEQTPNLFEWKLCSMIDRRRICSDGQPWKPSGEFSPSNSVRLADRLRKAARAVTGLGSGFLVATHKPNRLIRIADKGVIEREVPVEGEPVDFASFQGSLSVATRSPDRLEVFDQTTLAPEWSRPILFRRRNDQGQEISTRPGFIAASDNGVWILTLSGAGVAGLARLPNPNSEWQVPAYFDDIDFDLDGMVLRGGPHFAWAVPTNTVPSSLYLIKPLAFLQFTGHDHEVVSCATDVAPIEENVLLRTCEGELVELAGDKDTLRIVDSKGKGPVREGGEGTWSEELIARNGSITVVALNRVTVDKNYPPIRTQIVLFDPPARPRTLLELDEAKTISLATSDRSVFAILSNAEGHSDSVLLTF